MEDITSEIHYTVEDITSEIHYTVEGITSEIHYTVEDITSEIHFIYTGQSPFNGICQGKKNPSCEQDI